MADSLSGTARASARSLLVILVAGPLALTACGTRTSTQHHPSSPPRPSSVAAGAASEPSHGDRDPGKAAQEAAAQRAAAAPSGDPVHPTNTAVPDPKDYGFGKAAATASHGEVIAYTPRMESGRFVVPLTIHNGSDKRAAYAVTVTVVGGEKKSPFSVTAKADNVWPGTTWPTRVDITASGSKAGASGSEISLRVVTYDPFGDTR